MTFPLYGIYVPITCHHNENYMLGMDNIHIAELMTFKKLDRCELVCLKSPQYVMEGSQKNKLSIVILFSSSFVSFSYPQTLLKDCLLAIVQNVTCVQCFQFSENNLAHSTPWENCIGNDNDEKAILRRSSKSINGQKIRVVTVERPPFVKILDGYYSGVCFELFYALQDKYNFSREIFLPYDGNFGAELPNGTWTGMVGMVKRKDADIGVAGFSVTYERSRAVDFTESYHQEPTAILIPPPTEGEKLSVLIRPLSKEVWSAVGATMLTLAPTLYIMHIISLRIRGVDASCQHLTVFDTVTKLLHFMVGSLVQESVISPVDRTNRFLILSWWMMTIIISNIYVAYLVSYLSSPRLFNVVNSLEDLVHQTQIKWTFRKNSALESLFKSPSSKGVYKAVGDGVPDADLVTTDYDGAEKALTGKYAFIKEKSFLDVALGEDFKKTHICRITVAKQNFFKVETAFIVQQGSELREVFNYGIRWSLATGVMEQWKRIHWPRDILCQDAVTYIPKTQPKTRKLNFEDVQGAYFIFSVGLAFAIISFVVEICTRFTPNCCTKPKHLLPYSAAYPKASYSF